MKAITEKHNTTRTSTFDSVEEFAIEIGISRAIAYRELRKGTIPSIRVGKRFVIPRAAIAEWLRNCGGREIA
jgi:excisionase family DNA binding protein